MESTEIDGQPARDEWDDADFEIPDGPLVITPNAHSQSHAPTTDADAGDDDWDIEMGLGRTPGARAAPARAPGAIASITAQLHTAAFAGTVTRLGAGGRPVEFDWDECAAPALRSSSDALRTHAHAPRSPQDTLESVFDWDADEEAATPATATIRRPADRPFLVPMSAPSLSSTSDFTPTATAPYTPLGATTALPTLPRPASNMDDDFEADFDLPGDLSQLSLRPLHQSTSRGTVGSPGDPWLDYASMSTTTHSSETSSLGFGHHASPSTSAWSGGTETDEDDYAFLDGVVVPDGMFDKENKANLSRLLDTKKKTPAAPKPKHVLHLGEHQLYYLLIDVLAPNALTAYIENDDFLDGLVLDDHADLSPSKLNKRTTPPRPSNRPPAARSAPGARSPNGSPAKVRPPSRTTTLTRPLSPPLSRVSSPPPRGPIPGRRGATSPTPTRAAGALLTRLTVSSPAPSFERKPITPSTSAPSRQWSQSGKVTGPRPPPTKRQVIRKGSLQSLVDSVAEVFSDSDARGRGMFGFERHYPVGSASRPVRPTLAPSYSAVTGTPAARASYNAPTAASRARSAMGMHDRDGAASDREGRGGGMLSPDQQRWIVPNTRPNTPTQNAAAVRLQGFMRPPVPVPVPTRPTPKNMFLNLNASTTSTSSVGSSWSNAAIAPSKSVPVPAKSFAAIVKSPPALSPRVLSPVLPAVRSASGPHRPRAMTSLANAKVTVPLPAGAVEVKRPRRPRAPSGIWGDGTELDALDDLSVDPTLERQFQVQAKGVHEGGMVKRFEDRGKGPVGMRITHANDGLSARGLANGTVDLAKFREPDVPKKRERERERKPFITLHPPPVASGSALLQVPARKPNPKRKRERGPPPSKRPNLIRNMNGTKSPKGLWRFFTLTTE